MGNYLTFSSPSSFTLETYKREKNWDGVLEYSTDTITWNEWDGTTTLSAESGKLYLRGTGNTVITGDHYMSYGRWVLHGSNISCDGNIENLLDYAIVANGEHPTMGENCYASMFSDCTSLVNAPELPATTLAEYCYYDMFYGCTSLVNAPELPATTLAGNCYCNMFSCCTSLINAPELPATTLAYDCYAHMFHSCTSLVNAPELPATTLAEYCYDSMFTNCPSLVNAPALPATTLARSCYTYMFWACTSLVNIPALPATTLAYDCYAHMFDECPKIKLSATQTEEYATPYRIPMEGTGTTAPDALTNMFSNTGGTFTGTPDINTTYYTSNEVIYPEGAKPKTTIIYNGKTIATLEAGQTAIFPKGKKATGDVTISFGSKGSITYKGVTTEVEAGKTARLLVKGKKFSTDVVVSAK